MNRLSCVVVVAVVFAALILLSEVVRERALGQLKRVRCLKPCPCQNCPGMQEKEEVQAQEEGTRHTVVWHKLEERLAEPSTQLNAFSTS